MGNARQRFPIVFRPERLQTGKHSVADHCGNTMQPLQIGLSVAPEMMPGCFTQVLSKGVGLNACLPCSVKELLCDQIGITEDYLDNRIQTLFLNGQPVDDVRTASVFDGAVLALSAAMPGLAGAVLRKGGYYAGMRREITLGNQNGAASACDGRIAVKLFNMTIREIGPLLLERGVWVQGSDLVELLGRFENQFLRDCCRAVLNEAPVPIADLPLKIDAAAAVLLRVTTA